MKTLLSDHIKNGEMVYLVEHETLDGPEGLTSFFLGTRHEAKEHVSRCRKANLKCNQYLVSLLPVPHQEN